MEKLRGGVHAVQFFAVSKLISKVLCVCARMCVFCVLILLTLKNSFVEPESRVPYAISVCLARSSALSIGETILSTVKKAARLAV